jgi:hypothetical protein
VIAAGALTAAAGAWCLSRIPVHGTCPGDLLPGLVLMASGIGAVLVSVTTAATAGVPSGQSRTRRRPAERLPAARHRPRPGDLLRHRHRPHQHAAHRPRPPRRRAHARLPPRPAGLRAPPARRRRHRAARHQQPRRARHRARRHPRRPRPGPRARTGRLTLVRAKPSAAQTWWSPHPANRSGLAAARQQTSSRSPLASTGKEIR